MKIRHYLFLVAGFAALAGQALAAYTYFTSAPSPVGNNQSYYVEAVVDSAWYGASLTIWKNGNYFADGSGYSGAFAVGNWTSDSGPQTIEYHAEAWDFYDYSTSYDYAYITVNAPANNPPTATVEVDGYGSGATVTRPYGGSVNVTVRYKATDADGNLSGIRPQVWEPSGTLNNNGGNFVGQSGGSGEVTWTVTLNQDGDWYFWTDATDSVMAPDYVNSGPWGSGFRLHVVEAPPPNYPPTATVWANTSTLYTGETAQIYVRGQDGNGNARYFNLDQVSPLNCFYGPGDSFVSSQQPNNGAWDLGSDSGDYTRTVSMLFDRPGVYHWRGAVQDSAGSGWQYSPTNHVITVPNRDPSVSIQILNASQQVIGLNGNSRAPVPVNTQFYIRVNGSDPDGRLLRLYSRINNPSGTGYAYEQRDVSGGNASWTFGPYTANQVGVWDVWGHSEDLDNTGYQWQGGGWWGSHGPDIEVYNPNTAPTGSWHTLPGAISYGMNFTCRASGHDNDGNLAQVAVDVSVNGGAWSAFAYNGGGNGYDSTSDPNVITAGVPGTTYQFRYYVSDGAGANTGWVTSALSTAAKTTPAGSFASRTLQASGSGYTVQSADLSATFANPYPGQVSGPTGPISYSIVVGGSGPVTAGTSLAPSTYTIRATYPGDANYNGATADATWTISSAPTYTFTVENGTGGASDLPSGTVRSITANNPPSGQVFVNWTLVSGPGAIANASATSTTFTTGSGNATVRANYVAWDPNADADGDGLSNATEQQLGTNPNSPAQSDSNNTTQLKVHRPN